MRAVARAWRVARLRGIKLRCAGACSPPLYREDLKRNPANGWALFGTAEAARIDAEFMRAWTRADIKLTTTAF